MLKHERLAALAKNKRVATVVDDVNTLNELANICKEKDVKCGVVVEVDIGQRRCGVQPSDVLQLAKIAHEEASIEFWGLQGYQVKLLYII